MGGSGANVGCSGGEGSTGGDSVVQGVCDICAGFISTSGRTGMKALQQEPKHMGMQLHGHGRGQHCLPTALASTSEEVVEMADVEAMEAEEATEGYEDDEEEEEGGPTTISSAGRGSSFLCRNFTVDPSMDLICEAGMGGWYGRVAEEYIESWETSTSGYGKRFC